MDIYLAATLLEKSWTAIDGAVTKQPGGLLLDAAVMAEVIHMMWSLRLISSLRESWSSCTNSSVVCPIRTELYSFLVALMK